MERRHLRTLGINLFAVIALGGLVAGCASAPMGSEAGQTAAMTNDPYETTNRDIFGFNQDIDHAVLKPVAESYRDNVNADIREGIHNVLSNMSEPVNFVNAALQGKDVEAMNILWRFLVNSTVGIGGIGDVAKNFGYPRQVEDFGQTLAVWGVSEGPYLMLPLLGPSNTRDLAGRIVDSFTNPIGYFMPTAGSIAAAGVRGIDSRERNIDTIDDLEKNSLDFYAALRSLYRQNRQDLIDNGEPSGPVLDIPVYAE